MQSTTHHLNPSAPRLYPRCTRGQYWNIEYWKQVSVWSLSVETVFWLFVSRDLLPVMKQKGCQTQNPHSDSAESPLLRFVCTHSGKPRSSPLELPLFPRPARWKEWFAPDEILNPILYSQPRLGVKSMETTLTKNLHCSNYAGVHIRPNYPSTIWTLNYTGKTPVSHPKLNISQRVRPITPHIILLLNVSTSWVLTHLLPRMSGKVGAVLWKNQIS